MHLGKEVATFLIKAVWPSGLRRLTRMFRIFESRSINSLRGRRFESDSRRSTFFVRDDIYHQLGSLDPQSCVNFSGTLGISNGCALSSHSVKPITVYLHVRHSWRPLQKGYAYVTQGWDMALHGEILKKASSTQLGRLVQNMGSMP